MHVTDWLPTLLDLAGCPNEDFGGLPLDGKSQASAILSNVENEYSIRQERGSPRFSSNLTLSTAFKKPKNYSRK